MRELHKWNMQLCKFEFNKLCNKTAMPELYIYKVDISHHITVFRAFWDWADDLVSAVSELEIST